MKAPPTDEQIAAYIGPSWQKAYRRKFERFWLDPHARFKASWNWKAALLPVWFLLHRLYIPFVALFTVVFGASQLAGGTESTDSPLVTLAYALLGYLAWPVVLLGVVLHAFDEPGIPAFALLGGAVATTALQGVIADWLFYRKALAAASAMEVPATQTARPGGLRLPPSVSPAGYVVIVVIVLVPAWANMREMFVATAHTSQRAHIAAMKGDLRNLVSAEESYFTDHGTYTDNLARLTYSTASADTVHVISASRTGWSAVARSGGLTGTCGIFVGTATPPVSGQLEAEPRCAPQASTR